MQASAAAPQGWFKLPAAPPSCCQPPPVGPPAPAVARQDHKNIGGTPTRSGLQQLRAPPDEACLSVKHLPAITATWQRTSLGKSRPRASRVCPAGQAELKMLHRQGFNRQPAPILLAGLWSLGPNRLIGRCAVYLSEIKQRKYSKLQLIICIISLYFQGGRYIFLHDLKIGFIVSIGNMRLRLILYECTIHSILHECAIHSIPYECVHCIIYCSIKMTEQK